MSAKEVQFMPNQIIFEEGAQSTHLYYVKSGMVRIFKRKLEGNIEIDTIHPGQMLGELSFLDSQPRSASAEALTTCEMIEITKSALDEAMKNLPDWFVAMTRTITSRLRNATNRIRQIDTLSTEYETDKEGNRSKEYTYISTSELLKFTTALLTVASRYGKNQSAEGIEFPSATLDRFASQVLQVSAAKVVSLVELFKEIDILRPGLLLTDIRFLDQFIQFVNEQNIVETYKKRSLSERGFMALKLIVKNVSLATPLPDSQVRLNIALALSESKIQPSVLQELADQRFVQSVLINSATDLSVDFNADRLIFEYRTFWVLNKVEILNETKRRA